jgi:hypothetical protein
MMTVFDKNLDSLFIRRTIERMTSSPEKSFDSFK